MWKKQNNLRQGFSTVRASCKHIQMLAHAYEHKAMANRIHIYIFCRMIDLYANDSREIAPNAGMHWALARVFARFHRHGRLVRKYCKTPNHDTIFRDFQYRLHFIYRLCSLHVSIPITCMRIICMQRPTRRRKEKVVAESHTHTHKQFVSYRTLAHISCAELRSSPSEKQREIAIRMRLET